MYKIFLKMKVVIVRTVTEAVTSEVTLSFVPSKALRPQVLFHGSKLLQTVPGHGLCKKMSDQAFLRLVGSAVRVFVDEQSHVDIPVLGALAKRGGAVGLGEFYFFSKANLFKTDLDLFGSARQSVSVCGCKHPRQSGERHCDKCGFSSSS